MRNGFTDRPRSEFMVTQHCGMNAYDLLCVECGWEGHATLPDAPWVVFQEHKCKPRTESLSSYN
jgi:hypothetical protein